MLMSVVAIAALSYLLVPKPRTIALGVVGVVAAMVHPLLAIVVGAAGVGIRHVRQLRRAREHNSAVTEDGVLAVELVSLGVVSGLTFRSAATLTAHQIEGTVAAEIVQALRSINAGEQPSARNPDIKAMFSAAEISENTGMPLAGTLTALASDRRRDAAGAAKESLARLPVKMLFPLAFLILPGFLLLVVVPPLISGLSTLGL